MAEDWWSMHLDQVQLVEVGLANTPNSEPYFDEEHTEVNFLALMEIVTLEAGDKYIQASIVILCSSTFAKGTVVSCKHNANRNIIVHIHDNPILDTLFYGGLTSKLLSSQQMTLPIAKAMVDQCNSDANDYMLWTKLLTSSAPTMPLL